MFDHHPQEGESVPAFSGSMLLVRAENTDAVKQIIKNDIYTRSGVWDEEKVQIIPVCFFFLPFFPPLYVYVYVYVVFIGWCGEDRMVLT